MNLLPTSWSNALAPNFELANRFAKGEVGVLENLSIRISHFAQAAMSIKASPLSLVWGPGGVIIGSSAQDLSRNYTKLHHDIYWEYCNHMAWVIMPFSQSQDEYAKDLQHIYSTLWKVAAGVLAIALAYTAGPSLAGRIGQWT